MEHAWCSDAGRDAAVRAAEDGRAGPLPTLEEAISRAGKIGAEDPRADAKCTERDNSTVSGLRTERVTLEITGAPGWRVSVTGRDVESVRVVEEAHFDDLAQVVMERDAAIRERDTLRARVAELEAAANTPDPETCGWAWAEACAMLDRGGDPRKANVPAMWDRCRTELGSTAKFAEEANAGAGSNHAAPPASGGAEGEPAQWAVLYPTGRLGSSFDTKDQADSLARNQSLYELTVVPLYRSPPPPRGWLTEKERACLEKMRDELKRLLLSMSLKTVIGQNTERDFIAIESILARSTPPEVVLPKPPFARSNVAYSDWMMCLNAVNDSLAAAGVKVKEAT